MLRIVENLGEFVYESVPEHTILKCRITRNRKGVDKGSHKFYALQLKLVRRPTKMRTLKKEEHRKRQRNRVSFLQKE